MKINIIFVIPSLRAGGAERVMSFLAENLDSNKFNSQLLVIGTSKDTSYNIKKIPVTFLEKEKVRQGVFPIIKFISKNKPHIVISAIAHLNTAIAALSIFFPKTKFIGRETTIGLDNKQRISLSTELKKRLLDKIICQSVDMKNDLILIHNYPKKKLSLINNPVTEKFKLKNGSDKTLTKQLITVGRLVKQKGHERILNGLAQIKTPFHYTIIGDGSEKDNINHLIEKHKLKDKVTLINFSSTIETHLQQSDLFLQGSYVEGFPNALIESCAVGTPVLAYKAPGGIDEIILPSINGEIANNDIDFIKKLDYCLKHDWSPEKIRNSVLDRFSEKIILKKYEELFTNILSRKYE